MTKVFTEQRMKNLISEDKTMNLATKYALHGELAEMEATGEYKEPEEFSEGLADFMSIAFSMRLIPEETEKILMEHPKMLIHVVKAFVNGIVVLIKDFSTQEGYDVFMNYITENLEEFKDDLKEELYEMVKYYDE